MAYNSFITTIREKIGEDLYTQLETEADKEVALAMQFEIVDQWRQDRYCWVSAQLRSFPPQY